MQGTGTIVPAARSKFRQTGMVSPGNRMLANAAQTMVNLRRIRDLGINGIYGAANIRQPYSPHRD
jgi:hypothetical protein